MSPVLIVSVSTRLTFYSIDFAEWVKGIVEGKQRAFSKIFFPLDRFLVFKVKTSCIVYLIWRRLHPLQCQFA